MPHIAQQLAMRHPRTGYLALCEPAGTADPLAAASVHVAPAGVTMPVTWRALDADGVPVTDPQHFAELTSSTSDGHEDRAGGSGPRYLGDGYWRFNWQTPGTYAGQRRTMTLSLRDGSTRAALLAFR